MSTGKFREKEIVPSPEEDARLSGVAHGGTWKETGSAERRIWLKQNSTQRIVGWGTEYVPKPPQLSTENECEIHSFI